MTVFRDITFLAAGPGKLAFSFHYDHNRWVRQDVFDADGKRTTRYLTYVWTAEDEMLKTIDREMPFGTYKTQ